MNYPMRDFQEHLLEAERLLEEAAQIFNPEGDNEHDGLVARAQVHAILANALRPR